jgi:hypothetical protein
VARETRDARWLVELSTELTNIRSVVDKVTLGQVCVEIFLFLPVSIIPPMIHKQLHHRAALVRGTRRRRLGTSKQSNALSYLMCVGPRIIVITEEYEPSRHHLLSYCTAYKLNMFRTLLCPSSGARDYNVDYHIGRLVLVMLLVGI